MSSLLRIVKKCKKIAETTFNVKRALHFVWVSSKGWAVTNVVLLFIQGILPVVSIYLLKLLVDSVVAALNGTSTDALKYEVYTIVYVVGSVVLLTGLSRAIGALVNKEESRRIADHMHDVIHKKAIKVGLEYYENPAYQNTLHRAQEDATFRPIIIVNSMATILQNTISLFGVAWLLLVFKWPIFVLLISAVIPEMVVRFVFSSKEYLNERSYTEKERHALYYHWLLVGREHAKEIRLFDLGHIIIERFRRIRTELRNIRLSLDKKNAFYSSIAHICTTLFVFAAYFWVTREALLGIITIGSFVMFYQAFQKGQMFLQGLFNGVARLYENNLFLSNLYEFLDIEDTLNSSPKYKKQQIPENTTRNCRLEIRNVCFQYPSTSKHILNNLSMTIKPGEVAALVGENGSGKTTLVKLICRLYDVSSGSISINGVDIRSLDPKDLRSKIGVIFQDYPHYNLSVRDNIYFGDINKPPDSLHIKQSAEQAGATNIIKALPSEYDTILGRMFEDGIELSEGQWQKIALARAFFRDSHMIILDEPTSSIDPKSEYELFQRFKEILNGRTSLLISHRMSTVRMADKIFVMNEGYIVESGTHEQLMSADGIYADLFKTQAKSYSFS